MLKKLKNFFIRISHKKENGLKGFIIRSLIFIGLLGLIKFFVPIYKTYANHTIIELNSGYTSFMTLAVIALFLLTKKEKISKSYKYSNKWGQTVIYAILAIIMFAIPSGILEYGFHIHKVVSYFLLYGLGIFFTFLSVFNWNFPMRYMQEEILIILLIIMGTFSIPLIFNNLWEIFFYPNKIGTNFLLNIFTDNFEIKNYAAEGVIEGFYVQLENFKAVVGPSCSGIYSLIAFSFLYIASLLFLHKGRKINGTKAFKYFSIGIILLYLLNIIRITILMYVGAYISETLAIDLFHEYLSSIFLMSIFLIYLYKLIPKVFEE